MKAILIIIEKVNDQYTAYSPNLLGCVAEGRTREEVERLIITAVGERLELLKAQAQRGLEANLLLQGLIEESIQCIGKTLAGQQCRLNATKDGLCTKHWHVLYGHKMNAGSVAPNRFCLICGYKEGKNELISSLAPCPGRVTR
jgi:predicted RNase H-like HicB family nuclease